MKWYNLTIKRNRTGSPEKEDKIMMNTMTNNKLNMEELEIVNGGGFFDFISDVVDIAKDFVIETAVNMKVPAMNVTEFIADGLCDKLADFTVDVLKQLNG